MKKVDTIDEVMAAIRKASRADDNGDWFATVELDVTGCFDTGDIRTFDEGNVLLINNDCIPIKGEVTDGEYTGEYEIVNLVSRSARLIAHYMTVRSGDEQAAYAPGARR